MNNLKAKIAEARSLIIKHGDDPDDEEEVVFDTVKFRNIGNFKSEDEIYKKFPWLKNARISGAHVSTINNKLIWHDGSFEKGTWEDGIWENGNFYGSVWKNGTWKNGTWENGIWKNGTWINGKWNKGIWENGTWKNGSWYSGTWKNGTWENGQWTDKAWGISIWEKGIWKNGEIWVKDKYYYKPSKVNPKEFYKEFK